MAAKKAGKVHTISSVVNDAFKGAKNKITSRNIKKFLEEYERSAFIAPMARRDENGGVTLTAGFKKTANGGIDTELSHSDITRLLDALKEDKFKTSDGQGGKVTAYPNLVIELKKAEKNLETYAKPDMIAHITRGQEERRKKAEARKHLRTVN